MLAAEPVAVEATTNVADVESTIFTAFTVSPFVKTKEVLFVPVCVYFTYNVSGSVPSVATELTTIAFTPDVAPVSVAPI